MARFIKANSRGFKIFATLVIVSAIAGICFFIASTTDCHSVGLGAEECNGGLGLSGSLILFAVGGIAPIILAPVLLKYFGVRQAITTVILIGILPVAVAWVGTSVWNKHSFDRNNSQALQDLTNQAKQIGFTFYVPSYIPPGFYENMFLPSGDSASLSYSSSSDYTVGITLEESKITPTNNAMSYCTAIKSSGDDRCIVFVKDNSGNDIYKVNKSSTDDIYIVDHLGTQVKIANDKNHPQSQDELVKMLNSLQPQSKQQLVQLVKHG